MKKLFFTLLFFAMEVAQGWAGDPVSVDTVWTKQYIEDSTYIGYIGNALFTPDDSKILLSTNEQFVEIDAKDGHKIKNIYGIGGAKMFSQDGKYIYTYDQKKINFETLESVTSFTTPLFPWKFSGFDISELGNFYIGYVTHATQQPVPDSAIAIFDLLTGKLNKLISLPGHYIYNVAVSKDGKYFATSSCYQPYMNPDSLNKYPPHGSIYIWDAQTYQIVRKISDSIYGDIKFSSDGRFFAVVPGHYPYLYNYVNLFNLQTGECTYLGGENIGDFIFSSDSKYLFEASHAKIRRYETGSDHKMYIFPGDEHSYNYLNISNNNDLIISGNEVELYLWSITNLTNIIESPKDTPVLYPNPTTGPIILDHPDILSGQLHIDLIDIYGNNLQILYNGIYNSEDLKFDISSFPAGVYFLKAVQMEKVQVFKVMKQ
jgi:WD40 repeat protein